MARSWIGAVSAAFAGVLTAVTLASCAGGGAAPQATAGAGGATASGLADGTYYGYAKSFDAHSRALRFERVEYVFGPAKAEKLCRRNGVPVPPEGELCHSYYLKDDKTVTDATASKSVHIADWHKFGDYRGRPESGDPYRFSLKQFARTVAGGPGGTELFRFTVKTGQVVAISGTYLP